MTIDNIIEEIDKAKSIVILTHETPDGDAIGSSLALYHIINDMGEKRVNSFDTTVVYSSED